MSHDQCQVTSEKHLNRGRDMSSFNQTTLAESFLNLYLYAVMWSGSTHFLIPFSLKVNNFVPYAHLFHALSNNNCFLLLKKNNTLNPVLPVHRNVLNQYIVSTLHCGKSTISEKVICSTEKGNSHRVHKCALTWLRMTCDSIFGHNFQC